jgi:GT2 family glycosyltransferase
VPRAQHRTTPPSLSGQLPRTERVATEAATLVVVAYRTERLDLSWLPDGAEVIVVHNDACLVPKRITGAVSLHLRSGRNEGFGAAVNRAARAATRRRLVLCNPDVRATAEHWRVLTAADPNTIVVVPLRDASGRSTSVVNRYPSRAGFLAGAWRLGRLASRGGRARKFLAPLLGSFGKAHSALTDVHQGSWPLTEYWASGALLSVDTARFRTVGGFDEDFFLYYEDVDLCRRLASRYPHMGIMLAPVSPAVHVVGASAKHERARVELHRLNSARHYVTRQRSLGWAMCGTALAPRSAWLRWRASP